MRYVIALITFLGLAVGAFWLFAIDAGMNGASWVPNWHSWFAYASCPFVPLVGLNRLANIMVPICNGALYGLLAFVVIRVLKSRRGHESN